MSQVPTWPGIRAMLLSDPRNPTVFCEHMSAARLATPCLDSTVSPHTLAVHPRLLFHADVEPLLSEFIAAKAQHGSTIEKQQCVPRPLAYLAFITRACSYQDMSAAQLIDRLLRKRPLSFMNPEDSYLLSCGRTFDTHAPNRKTSRQQCA